METFYFIATLLGAIAAIVTIITGCVIFVKWRLKKKRESKIMGSNRDEFLNKQSNAKPKPGVPDIKDL